jgi:hypothetical protein
MAVPRGIWCSSNARERGRLDDVVMAPEVIDPVRAIVHELASASLGPAHAEERDRVEHGARDTAVHEPRFPLSAK